jgi:hypothetical protein
VCHYNFCHGNAAKGFWALWDNIYYYMCLHPSELSSIPDWQLASTIYCPFLNYVSVMNTDFENALFIYGMAYSAV